MTRDSATIIILRGLPGFTALGPSANDPAAMAHFAAYSAKHWLTAVDLLRFADSDSIISRRFRDFVRNVAEAHFVPADDLGV